MLLTGTPLQNTVEELFSLLHFLEPGRFPSETTFMQEFGDLKTEEQVNLSCTILHLDVVKLSILLYLNFIICFYKLYLFTFWKTIVVLSLVFVFILLTLLLLTKSNLLYHLGGEGVLLFMGSFVHGQCRNMEGFPLLKYGI